MIALAALAAAPAARGQLPPLPFGTAVSVDGTLLFRTEPDAGSVAVIDIDPLSPTFEQRIASIDVGRRPLGIAAAPDGADVHVANSGSDTISIIDVATLRVRKTLTSPLIDRPIDVALGPREVPGGVAFASGTYHGFISNHGGDDVLVYESGPDGPAGIGFDDVIGSVRPAVPSAAGFTGMYAPRGVAADPFAPLDAFANTVGAFVAHRDRQGFGVASRIAYSRDASPGPDVVDTTSTAPGFGRKTFEVIQQYVSTHQGAGLDVALADEDLSIAEPTRLYLSMEGGVVDAFDLTSGAFVERLVFPDDVHDLSRILQP